MSLHHLSAPVRRECELVAKSTQEALTEAEQAELKGLQAFNAECAARELELAEIAKLREAGQWTFAVSTRSLQLERAQFLAAELAETFSESRTSRHTQRFQNRNIHGE